MRESPEAESQQSFCHQQIVKLKVSQDLAQLNWSADHLETNTGGVWIQHTRTNKNHSCHVLFGFTTTRGTQSETLVTELNPNLGEFPNVSWILQVLQHPRCVGAGDLSRKTLSCFALLFSLPQSWAAPWSPSQRSFIGVKR